MTTTTVEIHDDTRDCVTTLQIPEPLWLFAELLFRAEMIDEREYDSIETGPVVGSCHVLADKVVLRFHAGTREETREWSEFLEEEVTEPDEDEEGLQWWQ